jgi:hypothetical protein
MSNTYNSISKILNDFVLLHQETLNILLGITESMTSDSNETSFSSVVDGNSFTFKLPSFRFINNKIESLENIVNNFVSSDKNRPIIFDNKPLPAIKLDKINIKSLDVNNAFFKPNYFFENLLNPLIYVKLDIDELIKNTNINSDLKEVLVKKITIKKKDNQPKGFSINTYSNITKHDDLIQKLKNDKITYYENIEINRLTPIEITNESEFTITDILPVEISGGIAYDVVKLKNIDNIYTNSQLVYNNSNLYKIFSIDNSSKNGQSNNIVKLLKIQGFSNLKIEGVLNLVNDVSDLKELEVTIGVSEYTFIFIKPIDPINNVISKDFGYGIFLNDDDLLIQDSDGSAFITVSEFYNSHIKDFSKFLTDTVKIEDSNTNSTINNDYSAVYKHIPTDPKYDIISIGNINLFSEIDTLNKEITTNVTNNSCDFSTITADSKGELNLLQGYQAKIIDLKSKLNFGLKIKFTLDAGAVPDIKLNIIKYQFAFRYKIIDGTYSNWNIVETYERYSGADNNFDNINDNDNPLNVVFVNANIGDEIQFKYRKIFEKNIASEWSNVSIIEADVDNYNSEIKLLDSLLAIVLKYIVFYSQLPTIQTLNDDIKSLKEQVLVLQNKQ